MRIEDAKLVNLSRRSVKLRRIALAIIVALIIMQLAGCGDKEPRRYSTSFLGAFDTAITLIGYSDSQRDFDKYAELAEDRFLELHQIFDRYNAYEGVNNIYTLNHSGSERPVKVSADLIDMLEQSVIWQKESAGAVNIALGSVLEIWHDYRAEALADPSSARIPDREVLEAAAEHTSIDDLIIDKDAGTVYLADPDLKLDLGAVAKGYATEIVTRELREAGWDSFIISSGGNVRTTAAPPVGERKTWNIGIQDPEAALEGLDDELLFTLQLIEKSVVTSGDYQRYYLYEGRRYHHIVDPSTLEPASTFSSVTVVTEDSGLADFLSTTLFILPYEEGKAYIRQLGNVEAAWVFTDGTIEMTDGLRDMIIDKEG